MSPQGSSPPLRTWAEEVGAYSSLEMTTLQAPDLWAMRFNRCQPLPDHLRRELAARNQHEQAEVTDFAAALDCEERQREAA